MSLNCLYATWIEIQFQMQLLLGNVQYSLIMLILFSLPYRAGSSSGNLAWSIEERDFSFCVCCYWILSMLNSAVIWVSNQPKGTWKPNFFMTMLCGGAERANAELKERKLLFSDVTVSCSCCLVPSVRSSVPLVWWGSYEPQLCACVREQKRGGWKRGMCG